MELMHGSTDRDYSLDTAYIDVVNKVSSPVTIFGQITDCFKCPDVKLTDVDRHSNATLKVNTKFDYIIRIAKKLSADGNQVNDEEICSFKKSFQERSVSRIIVKETSKNSSECLYQTTEGGVNVYIPIYTAIGIYFIIGSIIYLLSCAYQRYKSGRGCYQSTDNQSLTSDARSQSRKGVGQDDEEADLSPVSVSTIDTSTMSERQSALSPNQGNPERQVSNDVPPKITYKMRRVKSLDAFRGLIILLMIFVNYGAGGYEFLEHKPWYGITIADIIFPAFIFMMGMSITLSVKSSLTRRKDYLLLTLKIVKRSFKLFMIGIILNTDYTPLDKIRIPGVLQRFSICYLIVALTHLLSVYRGNKFISRTEEPQLKQLLLIFAPEISIHSLILIAYLYFTLYFNYSKTCPQGYQGPGGLEENSKYFNCTGGSANYIDKLILGVDHIYQYPTSKDVYQTNTPHDPEGILGTLPSVLLTQIGLICGRILLSHRDHYKRLIRWFILSTVLGLIAFTLSSTDYIPVVKNLWSLSYVSLTGAISIFILIIFYLWIDVLKAWSKGVPFHYPGMNAILLYIGHIVARRYLPFWFNVDDASHSWLLFRDLTSTTIWLIISIYLYYSKIFFTL